MKNKITLPLLFTVVLALAFITGCSRDIENIEHLNGSGTSRKPSGVYLGNHITNIYATQYMRYAVSKKDWNANRPPRVQTTHLYVKLHPIDTTQFACIVDDTSINAFPYPLDYELIGEGNYVQPDSDTGWVYAVVPLGWAPLTSIPHILIDSCCIPNDNDNALLMVEEEELLKVLGPGGDRVSGRPHGYIKVRNTSTGGQDGLRRAKVITNTIVRCRTTYTNDNGYYSFTGGWAYITNVNYTVLFENIHDFKVWNYFNNGSCILPNAISLGVHSPSGYSYTIEPNNVINWRAATICNAASVFYNHLWNDLKIGRPIGGLRIGIYIQPENSNWSACTPMFRHRIYNPSEWYQYLALAYVTMLGGLAIPDMLFLSGTDSSHHIYSTIFHELLHVSHYNQVKNSTYWDHLVANTILNSGYGDSVSRPDYVGVSEMWAYYAEMVAYNYYRNNYNSLMPDFFHHGIQPDEGHWFKPENLQELFNVGIPNLDLYTLFQCMTSTNINHCTFRQEIRNKVNSGYWPQVDACFNGLCID